MYNQSVYTDKHNASVAMQVLNSCIEYKCTKIMSKAAAIYKENWMALQLDLHTSIIMKLWRFEPVYIILCLIFLCLHLL